MSEEGAADSVLDGDRETRASTTVSTLPVPRSTTSNYHFLTLNPTLSDYFLTLSNYFLTDIFYYLLANATFYCLALSTVSDLPPHLTRHSPP